MRKILSLAFVLVLLSAGLVQAEELKMAQCDLQKVAIGNIAFKEAQTTAEKKLSPLREQLEKERKSIEEEMKKLGSNPDKAKSDALYKRQSKYMRDATGFVENIQKSELLIRQGMDNLILQAATQYAKKNGYAMVLDTNAILHIDASLKLPDVTNEMIKEVDKVWRDSKKKINRKENDASF